MGDESGRRKRGRPGTYSSDAERAKAWRQRQRELIQAAKTAQPVVVEKIVEVERIVEKPVPVLVPAKAAQKARGVPDASKLFPLLSVSFTRYKSEENARRFRTNAAKAATAARDILDLAQYWGTVPPAEADFLRQVAKFFDDLNQIFQGAQEGAKRAAAKAEAERKAEHEAKIRELVTLTCGTAQAAEVLAMGEALLRFAKDAPKWLGKRFKVERADFIPHRHYELATALRRADAAKVARELAENCLEMGERGRKWKDGGVTGYYVGWDNFEEYRTNA